MNASNAIAKLNRFGSARAIAQHLIDLGCVGDPENGARCPVARYVTAETGEDVLVTSDWWVDGEGTTHPMPMHVSNLVFRIDMGYVPQLVGDPS